jgi:plasmid stability protein
VGDLLLRNVPDSMKRDLSLAAARAGVSLSDKAKDLLRQGLQNEQSDTRARPKSAWEALRQVALASGPDEEFVEIMRKIEADRKKDFGRPVEFPE